MSSKHWRRTLPFALAAVLLLSPAVSRAAGSGPPMARVHRSAPAVWLGSVWQALAGLWQKAADLATGTAPGGTSGTPSDAGTNGDSGNTIDPHG